MQERISQKCQSAVIEAVEWSRKYQRQQRSCKMPNQKNSKGKKSKRSNSNGDEQENGGCAAATGGAAAAAAPRSQRSSGKRGSGHRCRSLVMLCCLPGRGAGCCQWRLPPRRVCSSHQVAPSCCWKTAVSWSLQARSFDHDLRPRKNKMDGFGPSVVMWSSSRISACARL